MREDKLQKHWLDAFSYLVELCKIKSNETTIVLTETISRQVNINLVEEALNSHLIKFKKIELQSQYINVDPIIRSTGTSLILNGNKEVVSLLKEVDVVIDLSKEGLMHSLHTREILSSGTRIINISDEHPDVLSRLKPNLCQKETVKEAIAKCRSANKMLVESSGGSNLKINLKDTATVGIWGWTDRPGTLAHWPGGLVVCFPNKSSVNGKLVFQPGDINLTFKRYFDTKVTFDIENDFVTEINGTGLDAKLIKNYLEGFNDKKAYATSHVGWGLNPKARYEALTMYDKADINGTELRALSGNFLYSIGANEFANRYTEGHFDLPMMGCTIKLDDKIVVDNGNVV